MKKVFFWVFVGIMVTTLSSASIASEYDKGSPKGSHHDEVNMAKSKADMQNTMKEYITSESEDGILMLTEEKSGKIRNLNFMDLHESVGMKDGKHYSCADFKDVDSGEIVDVDIYVNVTGDGLEVSDAVIHKVDGQSLEGNDAEAKGSAKGSGY